LQAAILNASDLEHPMWNRISTSFEIPAPGTSGGILRVVSQQEVVKPSFRPRARAGPVFGKAILGTKALNLFYRERQTILGTRSRQIRRPKELWAINAVDEALDRGAILRH
jgi:hypothetical protein